MLSPCVPFTPKGQAQQGLSQQMLPVSARKPRDAKDKYAFWETQPVPQFSADEPAEV
jgi:hypothetical protein